jgi:hypothetical protein
MTGFFHILFNSFFIVILSFEAIRVHCAVQSDVTRATARTFGFKVFTAASEECCLQGYGVEYGRRS